MSSRKPGSCEMLKPCAISMSGGPYSDARCAGQRSRRTHSGTTPSAVSTRSRPLMCSVAERRERLEAADAVIGEHERAHPDERHGDRREHQIEEAQTSRRAPRAASASSITVSSAAPRSAGSTMPCSFEKQPMA